MGTHSVPALPAPPEAERAPAGGWPAVAAVAAVSFVLVLSEFLPVGLLPSISHGLRVDTGRAGLVVVVPGLAAAVAAPLLTMAAGRLDRRHVLLALAALIAVSDALAASASGLAVMVGARLLLGLAVGGFWAMGAGAGGRLVPPASVGRATALITAGISAGTVISLPLGSLIGHVADWRTAFVVAALAALLTLVALGLALPPLRPTGAVRAATLGSVLRTPPVALTLLIAAIVFFGHFTAYTYITPYLQQRAHLGPGAVTAVLLGYGSAGLTGNFLAGLASSRSPRRVLVVAALALAAAVLLLTRMHDEPAVVGLVLVWGAAFGAVPAAAQTRVMDLAGQDTDAALALLVSASQTFLAVGSFTGGLLTDHAGTTAAFALGGSAVLLSVLVPAGHRRVRG
ncbi:MFS transporter [Streptomyces sp. NPDC006655]|uniref:MFS transporter n=1 Tax=Streptomyces sp. NPDC006655 TaxID=3156898 RepID=UPI0034561425